MIGIFFSGLHVEDVEKLSMSSSQTLLQRALSVSDNMGNTFLHLACLSLRWLVIPSSGSFCPSYKQINIDERNNDASELGEIAPCRISDVELEDMPPEDSWNMELKPPAINTRNFSHFLPKTSIQSENILQILEFLIQEEPSSVCNANVDGFLPIHLWLMHWTENGRTRSTKARIALKMSQSYPYSSNIVDPVEHLYPFMLAALQYKDCLTTSFCLLQDHIALSNSIFNCTRATAEMQIAQVAAQNVQQKRL